MPKYNILLKDSKGFSYIKITKGWRNIYAVLQKDDDNADSLAEWFYSLPQETKDYYTRKYGKALTPKQMQQARGEEKAKGKQKEKASSVTAYPYYKPVEETIAKVNNAAETAKKNSSAENKPKGFSWVNKNNMTKVNW